MLRLLYKQGRKITQGYKLLIRIENGKGGVIYFDIVVLTEKSKIYACKFMQETEVVSGCTNMGVRMNITVCQVTGTRTPSEIQLKKWVGYTETYQR